MMNWWAGKGIDGFRMDVISLISKPKDLGTHLKKKAAYGGNAGEIIANGPHVHEYLKDESKSLE